MKGIEVRKEGTQGGYMGRGHGVEEGRTDKKIRRESGRRTRRLGGLSALDSK